MTKIQKGRSLYQGHTYNKLSREYKRYGNDPGQITPLELVEWAIDCGDWELEERDDDPSSMWVGPTGTHQSLDLKDPGSSTAT